MSEFGEGPSNQPKEKTTQPKEETNKPVEGKWFSKMLSRLRFQKPSRSSEGQTEYKRPSYKETREFKHAASERASKMSTEEICQFARENLLTSLADIASSQMPLSDIPKLYYTIDAALKEFNKRKVEKHDPDHAKLLASEGLIYAVIMNEGLSGPRARFLPPPDKRVGLEEKGFLILTHVRDAAFLIGRSPEMYGEKTQKIYEGIVERLNSKRAGIKGGWFSDYELPPFPRKNIPTRREGHPGHSEVLPQPEKQLSQEELAHSITELNNLWAERASNMDVRDVILRCLYENWPDKVSMIGDDLVTRIVDDALLGIRTPFRPGRGGHNFDLSTHIDMIIAGAGLLVALVELVRHWRGTPERTKKDLIDVFIEKVGDSEKDVKREEATKLVRAIIRVSVFIRVSNDEH